MSITKKARAGIVAGAAVAALTIAGIAGTAAANAADSTPSPSSSPGSSSSARQSTDDTRPQRPVEEQLTGDVAAKVEAAVTAQYPDATIDRMEKDADGMSVYEAHITKADGSHVTVMLDESFAITGEQAMGRGHGGPGGHGPGMRSDEEQLTGDVAAKVEAAVTAQYPDATIDRMEKDADGMSVYEAHITKADGSHVTVLIDASFAITGEQAMGRGHGGPGGHPHRGERA